jgi:hypothetical protein
MNRAWFGLPGLKAIEIVKSGKLDEPRFFSSAFGVQAKEGKPFRALQKKFPGAAPVGRDSTSGYRESRRHTWDRREIDMLSKLLF